MLTASCLGAAALRPHSAPLAAAALCSSGLAYGMNAVAVPVVVGRLTRPELFTKAYGRVFTGWGVGGLLAPWLAGRLYDRTGGYAASLLFAAGSAVVASIVALAVPRNGD